MLKYDILPIFAERSRGQYRDIAMLKVEMNIHLVTLSVYLNVD